MSVVTGHARQPVALEQLSPKSSMRWLIALAVAYLAAVIPTLSWLEFSSGMENLNVATVLEMTRGGPKLVPTLEGKPRIEKPAMPSWLTMAGVRGSTIDGLSQLDPATRDAAYRRLATQTRIAAVLAGAATIFATYAFGVLIGGYRVGLLSAVVFASNYFVLRYFRYTTTDVQLTLWVTVSNLLLARMLLDRVTWMTAIGAAVALGLAFMAKGPVSLVQTVLPAVAFIGVRRLVLGRSTGSLDAPRSRPIAPLVVGLIVAIVVATWWYAIVLIRDPAVMNRWLNEINPAGADRPSSNNFYLYFGIGLFLVPWTALFIDGVVRAIAALTVARRGRDELLLRVAYPALLLIGVLFVMSCFRDRKERYILPMIPIASIIAAQAADALLSRRKWEWPGVAHALTIAVLAVAPVVLMTNIVTGIDGRPLLSPSPAIAVAAIGAAIVGTGIFVARKRRGAMFVATIALMWMLHAIGIRAYDRAREGRSEMRPLAEEVWRRAPDAEMHNWRSDGREKRSAVDLSIYLNRPTTWVRNVTDIPRRDDRPQIYVTLLGQSEPEPEPAPGWTRFSRVRRDNHYYIAFIRGPVEGSSD